MTNQIKLILYSQNFYYFYLHFKNILLNIQSLVEALKCEDKTEEQAELIRLKTIELNYFKKIYEEKQQHIHLQVCHKLKYEFIKKGSTVYNICKTHFQNINIDYNDENMNKKFTPSDKFYILINGTLEMYSTKPSNEEEVGRDKDSTPQNNEENKFVKHNYNRKRSQKADKNELNLYLQKNLLSGSCFGDFGLVYNKSRTETIICVEDSHFAILEKQDFVSTIKPIEEKKLIKQTDFLESLPCFNGWPFHFLRDIFLNINKIQLHRGDYVYREGEKSKFAAIVTKGKFFVYKEFIVQSSKIVELKIQNELTTLQGERTKKNKTQEFNKSLQPFNINEQSQKLIKEYKKILEIGEHDLFGEDDIARSRRRQHSVRCESSEGGEIILISRQAFIEYVYNKEIAKKTIIPRIQLKERIFQDHIDLIEKNLQNFKNLLRENRQDLKNNKIKEQKLHEQSDEQNKNNSLNLDLEQNSNANNIETICCSKNENQNNELYLQNLDFQFLIKDNYNEFNEVGTFKSNKVSLINSVNDTTQKPEKKNSIVQSKINSIVEQIYKPENTPIEQARNSPLNRINQRDQLLSQFQLFEEQQDFPKLIEQANDVINKVEDRKLWQQNFQNNRIQNEEFCKSGQNFTSKSGRSNLMMDEKGNGIPFINPMKNEEELDIQVRKLLQKQPKRKNYLGQWKNGITQKYKVYGILRDAGYFDQKLQQIKDMKPQRQVFADDYESPYQSQHLRKGFYSERKQEDCNKTPSNFNQKVFQQEIQLQNEKHFDLYKLHKTQQKLKYNSIQDINNSINIMDNYLNQYNLSTIDQNYINKSIEYNKNDLNQKQNQFQTFENQNTPYSYSKDSSLYLQQSSQIDSNINNIPQIKQRDDRNQSLNYHSNFQKDFLQSFEKKILNKLSIQQIEQNKNNQQITTFREKVSSERNSLSPFRTRSRQLTARDARSKCESRGFKDYNLKYQQDLTEQSIDKRITPRKFIQDLQRPLTRNQILKSSTPVELNQRSASLILESIKQQEPKSFQVFNPSQNPLKINQQLKNQLGNQSLEPQFSYQSHISRQLQNFKDKKITQYQQNKIIQNDYLYLKNDQKVFEDQIFHSQDIIDYSKNNLKKLKKQIKLRDQSFISQYKK